MCGICGFFSKRSITREQLSIMNDTMKHRGPDDKGVEIYETGDGYSVGLAHRRLSILDLTSAGHQPMTSADGRLTVVFNGEIYNFQEIRNLLQGYSFISNCDTEIILAAYLRWGIESVNYFNGMFAVAIYDRKENELILIRDRIGKKPLYYWLDRDGIVFASELKGIMKCPGFERRIRKDILARYLLKQYICAPDTVFEDVYKLEHGCILRFRNGRIRTNRYWKIADIYHRMRKNPVKDYNVAKEELKFLLKSAVEKRMLSDVPLGALLSGGYDSSMVAAMAQEAMGGETLRTYCIGFYEDKFNEAQYAKKVAEYLGTDHTELYCDEKDMLRLVEDIPQYYDEPFADASEIPTMLVSMLARRDVTVALSGDGGDEFFCGYNGYDIVRRAERFDRVGKLMHIIGKVGDIESRYPFPVKVISQNTDLNSKTQVISQSYVNAVNKMAFRVKQIPVKYNTELTYKVKNWQIRRMLLDMDTYLPEDILMKVDRASMKYSLECRCPILDKEVMEYSFRISHEFKYSKGTKKAILKDITNDYIPRELMDRPKKGFSIPLDKWLRGGVLREKLIDYSECSFLKKQDIFDPNGTNEIIRYYIKNGNTGNGTNYACICWSFFVFQQWYEKYGIL